MKVSVCYPVPCESEEVWNIFKPCVERFTETWNRFPPGVKCSLMVVTCGIPGFNLRKYLPDGANVVSYDGNGMDLGCQQMLALLSDNDTFQVNFTTRAYFHRAGWLAKLVCARNAFGPALYGMTASHEGGHFHLCTRGYSYDVSDFRLYPHQIISRNQGVFFELGEGCIADWFKTIGRDVYIVGWNGTHLCESLSFGPDHFRKGDQSNVLVWDRHTEIYEKADPDEKARLYGLMMGQDVNVNVNA